jgi:uncharacterized membrane protein
MKKQIGIILLIIGIALLIWGVNLSSSFSSRVSRVFRGSPTNKTMTVFISGAVCTALGIYQLSRKSK